jgi:hypothetical protein
MLPGVAIPEPVRSEAIEAVQRFYENRVPSKTATRSASRVRRRTRAPPASGPSPVNRTTCLRDDLPNPAVVAVSAYLVPRAQRLTYGRRPSSIR